MNIKFVVMKRHIEILGLLVMFFLLGCYDDKGNYEYHDINSVEIEDIRIVYENNYIPNIGEEVIFRPELKFALDSTATNFTYEWNFFGEVVSHERVFHWIADTAGSFFGQMIFTVTDTLLNISYVYDDISIMVNDPNVVNNAGWLVLSELNGVSCLSLIQDVYDYEPEEPVYMPIVDVDMYAKQNDGESLGGKPLGMALFWTTPESFFDDPIRQVLILQEGGLGTIYVEASNFKKSISLSEEFFDGVLPAGETFVNAWDRTHTTALCTSDGQLYLRIKENPAIIFSGKFDEPLAVENGMNITHYAAERGYEGRVALVFDAANNRFLSLYDVTNIGYEEDNYMTHGALREIVEEENSTMLSLREMGNVDMLYVGASEIMGESYYPIVYRDNNVGSDNYGKVMIRKIRCVQNFSDDATMIYEAQSEWEIPFPGESFMNGNTIFANSKRDFEMLLFSGGANNTLLYAWPFEGENGGTVAPRAVFDFGGPAIKHIFVAGYGDALVALEDGTIYQFSMTEEILKEGGIRENTWWYKYEENFGDICSILRFPLAVNDW